MIVLNEPQVWATRGLFGATVFSMLAVVSCLFTKVDALDRDVQAIARRVFPEAE